MPRFNHMELTVPKGQLARDRAQISEFYREMFGFESLDVEILKQTGLLLRRQPVLDVVALEDLLQPAAARVLADHVRRHPILLCRSGEEERERRLQDAAELGH